MSSLITEYDEEKTLAANREEALEEGIELGLQKGVLTGINALIQDNFEEGKTKEQIIVKLMRHFSLSREQAEEYYIQYTGK